MRHQKQHTAFEQYYREQLAKDSLTDQEFKRMAVDWLLGVDFYIESPVNGKQANRMLLEYIMDRFPKSSSDDKNDQRTILSRCRAKL